MPVTVAQAEGYLQQSHPNGEQLLQALASVRVMLLQHPFNLGPLTLLSIDQQAEQQRQHGILYL